MILIIINNLDSLIPSDLFSLEMWGYNLHCGICIYYKESVPVMVINLPYIEEGLLPEVNYQNKTKIYQVFIALSVKTAKNSKVF